MIGSLEGANWICSEQIQLAPSKKIYSIYRLPDAKK